MVTSRYQFMNLKFVYPSKNMPTEHQLLVTVLAYGQDCRRQFRYEVSEKGGKMSQKQSTSACTCIRIHSEIGKENKLAFQKSYNLLIFTINPPPKGWNDDENETLHWIMMMVKNCTQKTIYINKNKKIKKFNYYYPPSPCYLFLFFALWK